MNKRAKICLYIFLICVFAALGVVGYFILGGINDEVMVAPKFFTFIEVPDADSYTLTASKKEDSTSAITANCKISKQETENENEFIYNNIVTDEHGNKLVEQTYNQVVTYVNKEEGTINCKICNYTITIFDSNGIDSSTYKYPDKELNNINENTICCLIAEYFGSLFNEDGKYNIKFVAVDSSGQIIEGTNKDYSFDYEACFENEFLKRESFYMNGTWNDYVITSNKELELFVWHAILYRENNVRFYIKGNALDKSNINNLVIECINSYPEYDGLYTNSSNLYATIDGNVAKLVNFNYYLDFDHTKTYKSLSQRYGYLTAVAEAEVQTKVKTLNPQYIITDDATPSEKRVLDIDNETIERDEVEVYNTEQLFMVIQYGAKPIIEDETSVVARVYNNAKSILLKVNNSNNLTQFEKALNIYRYVCGNIVYDHATLKYMEELDNYSVANFGNINCFYLEGALLDLENQYAVCDGLSKTYCLLANMEGLNCVKVNGLASGGNHAWNKIQITDAKYGINGWFPIDTTWGVEDNNNTEITTHTYFLRLGSESREVTFEPNDEEPQNLDYYKIIKYANKEPNIVLNVNYDFNISNDNELKDLINYAKSTLQLTNEPVVLEFKLEKNLIGYSYFDVVKALDYYPILSDRANTIDDNYAYYFSWLGRRVDLELNTYYYDAYYVGNVVVLSINKLDNVLNEQLVA